METKIEELKERLDFLNGQFVATTEILAMLIAGIPGADAFARDSLPRFAQLLEPVRRDQTSQAYWQGLQEGQKHFRERIEYWVSGDSASP